MRCSTCNAAMKPLFSSWYCPNEDNHNKEATSSVKKIDWSKINKAGTPVATPYNSIPQMPSAGGVVPPPTTTPGVPFIPVGRPLYRSGVTTTTGWPTVDLFSASAFLCVGRNCPGVGFALSVTHSPIKAEIKMRCPTCSFEWKVLE